jgi:hypothetical protein
VLRHVLEHVQDPAGFLAGLRESNGGGRKIYVEVPCMDWIADHHAWFDIFYEHVNYFRLADFKRLFGTVHEAGHCFSGPYLYVVADLASLKVLSEPAASALFDLPAGFMSAIDDVCARLSKQGGASPASASRARAVWGGRRRGDLLAVHGTRRNAHRHRHRHQPRQAGPLPGRHGHPGEFARRGLGRPAARRRPLRDEQQLHERNPGTHRPAVQLPAGGERRT